MSRLVAVLSAAALLLLTPFDRAGAQTASRVIRQFEERCSACHKNPSAERAPDVEGAPDTATLRRMSPELIYRAVTTGTMRVHVEGMTDTVIRSMVEWLSSRKLGSTETGDAKLMPNRCATTPPLGNPAAGAAWNGWGPDITNARYQKAGGLTGANIPRLKLKWAFGFPGASSVYGQPTVVGRRVLIGVDTGYVYLP